MQAADSVGLVCNNMKIANNKPEPSIPGRGIILVMNGTELRFVTPAKAGDHVLIPAKRCIPAFAGMTE